MTRFALALAAAGALALPATARAQPGPTEPPDDADSAGEGAAPDDAKPAAPGDEAAKPAPKAEDDPAVEGGLAEPDPDQHPADTARFADPEPGDARTPAGRPPPEYYVEPPSEGRAAPRRAPSRGAPPPVIYEPVPPGQGSAMIYEPPPPPKPVHVAPKTSLWVGARLGWFVPFGDVWRHCEAYDAYGCYSASSEKWSKYASSGPMFEVDVGMRLSRNYNLFVAWERAELGVGSEPGLSSADSDFYGLGLRASSDADDVGFLTELVIGYRRARSVYEDDTELQLTNAYFSARLGLGADIRISRGFALTPLATIGFGSFGNADIVQPNGDTAPATGPDDFGGSHGWLTLQLGGHFDIAGGD